MSELEARLRERHHEWNNQGCESGTCECGDDWPCPQLADINLLLAELDRLKALVCDQQNRCIEAQRQADRADKAEAELAQCDGHGYLRGEITRLEAELVTLQDEGIAENHAIMTLTGTPREGYTLQQEIRAQLEETQADLAAERERAERLENVARECLTYFSSPNFTDRYGTADRLREALHPVAPQDPRRASPLPAASGFPGAGTLGFSTVDVPAAGSEQPDLPLDIEGMERDCHYRSDLPGNIGPACLRCPSCRRYIESARAGGDMGAKS